jgi:hypothetical protein
VLRQIGQEILAEQHVVLGRGSLDGESTHSAHRTAGYWLGR